jgi:hypothetical protein
MPVGCFHGLRDLLVAVGKEKRLGGEASEQDAVDGRKVGRTLPSSWQMASVSLLKMPAAIFAPMSEAFFIWDFQAATSWRTSSFHLLSSSMSSYSLAHKT